MLGGLGRRAQQQPPRDAGQVLLDVGQEDGGLAVGLGVAQLGGEVVDVHAVRGVFDLHRVGGGRGAGAARFGGGIGG